MPPNWGPGQQPRHVPDWESNQWLFGLWDGMAPNPLSHTSQGYKWVLLKKNIPESRDGEAQKNKQTKTTIHELLGEQQHIRIKLKRTTTLRSGVEVGRWVLTRVHLNSAYFGIFSLNGHLWWKLRCIKGARAELWPRTWKRGLPSCPSLELPWIYLLKKTYKGFCSLLSVLTRCFLKLKSRSGIHCFRNTSTKRRPYWRR